MYKHNFGDVPNARAYLRGGGGVKIENFLGGYQIFRKRLDSFSGEVEISLNGV